MLVQEYVGFKLTPRPCVDCLKPCWFDLRDTENQCPDCRAEWGRWEPKGIIRHRAYVRPTAQPRPSPERNREICTRHKGGETYRNLALAFGMSTQRVCQIVQRKRWRDATVHPARLIHRVISRPIDMGGPRDVWIETDIIDEQSF